MEENKDPVYQELLNEVVNLKEELKEFHKEYQDDGIQNIGWAGFAIAVSMILIGTGYLDKNNIALLVLEGAGLMIFSFLMIAFGKKISRWGREILKNNHKKSAGD